MAETPQAKSRISLFWLSVVALSLAIIAVGAVYVVVWELLVRPLRSATAAEHLAAYFELGKISLAIVAAAGASVGLVVAYRRQQTAEDTHALSVDIERRAATESKQSINRDRMRLFNERFTSASQQLGSDRASIRLAGVYAMAGLADDWEDQRQTCIDVLCGYFRMSSESDGSDEEVRNAVFQVIRDHLADNTPLRWQNVSFNFRGAQFTGQDLSDIVIDGVKFDFRNSTVTAGGLSFVRSKFLSGDLDFQNALVGGSLNFAATALRQDFSLDLTELTFADDGCVHLEFVNVQDEARINLGVNLNRGSTLSFRTGTFHGGRVSFSGLHMDGGLLDLRIAIMAEGIITWHGSLLQTGTILIPDDPELAARLGIPTDPVAPSNGLIIQTSPRG